MGEYALALGFVILAWWASTAAVMWLAWQARSAQRLSLGTVGVLAVGAAALAFFVRFSPTAGAAYLGLAAALVLWGWHELAFLLGVVTGPRREPCPPDAVGGRRFRLATATVIHHELALAATLVLLAALSWGAPNAVAFWTFAGLWALRLSAKLNLFFGVAHVSDELVPPHLRYLTSYFRRRPGVSPWLLLALLATVAASVVLTVAATGAEPGYPATALSLLAALALLGVLEHLFLAFPMQDARLWRWVLEGISARQGRAHELPVPAFAGGDDRTNGGDDG